MGVVEFSGGEARPAVRDALATLGEDAAGGLVGEDWVVCAVVWITGFP